MAHIYLLRHGQTDMNTRHMLQGRIDTQLNAAGREQARKAGDFFRKEGIRPDVVISSPLSRPQETGEIATGIDRKNYLIEPLLVEMAFGVYEGIDVERLHPKFYYDFFHHPEKVVMPEGAETFADLMERGRLFLEKLRAAFPPEDKRTVLCLGHGAICHAILANIDHTPLSRFWDVKVDNCAVYRLTLPASPAGRVQAREVFAGWSWKTAGKADCQPGGPVL